jgi:hypothetical protein
VAAHRCEGSSDYAQDDRVRERTSTTECVVVNFRIAQLFANRLLLKCSRFESHTTAANLSPSALNEKVLNDPRVLLCSCFDITASKNIRLAVLGA